MLQHGPPCLAFGQRARSHANTMYGHNFSFLSFLHILVGDIVFLWRKGSNTRAQLKRAQMWSIGLSVDRLGKVSSHPISCLHINQKSNASAMKHDTSTWFQKTGLVCIPYIKFYNSFKLWEVKIGWSQKFHLTFKIGSNVRRAHELLIDILSQRRIKPTLSSLFGWLYI